MKKMFLILAAACVFMTAACGTTAGVATDILEVEGLCGMCKTRIEQTAKGVDGVTKAEWDRDAKILTLEFDPSKTKLETISKALAKVGHDTEMDKADNDIYDALPDCCKYRV